MKKTIAMSVMLALAPAAQAADIEAGKAKVAKSAPPAMAPTG